MTNIVCYIYSPVHDLISENGNSEDPLNTLKEGAAGLGSRECGKSFPGMLHSITGTGNFNLMFRTGYAGNSAWQPMLSEVILFSSQSSPVNIQSFKTYLYYFFLSFILEWREFDYS